MAEEGKKMRMKDYLQARTARLNIISEMYKRGYSYRQIRAEVMKRLDLKTYSTGTVCRDVKCLLKEWRSERLDSMDDAVQLELTRIDDLIREAWGAWEKSKNDYLLHRQTAKGVPTENEDGTPSQQPEILSMYQSTSEVVNCGDVRYLELIHKLLIERRKILGLYAPDKLNLSGEVTFEKYLKETGIIDETE